MAAGVNAGGTVAIPTEPLDAAYLARPVGVQGSVNFTESERKGMLKRSALSASMFLAATVSMAAQAPEVLPKVLVIATGGTIAGEQQEPGTLGRYDIKKTASEIVASVPIIAQYAQVETEQFSNIPSPAMTPDHWLKLARRINELFEAQSDLSGIVVTHGTARLEETAFFLHVTVKSDRPVVVVGAQRPPTGISPDGPLNLLSAIRVAASPKARGMGVMVVMDDRILSARDVKKAYARGGGFDTGEMGMLGVVAEDSPAFFYAPAKKHTANSDFDVSKIFSLPKVEISYSYAGAEGIVDERAKGVIVTTTGFTPGEREYYAKLRRRGTMIATAFPSGEQASSQQEGKDQELLTVISSSHLFPTKARILMMLALSITDSPTEIQRIFSEY